MGEGDSPLGSALYEAHEAALKAASQHCHFEEHARNAVKAYMATLSDELKLRGLSFGFFKIRDEQDNQG